MCHEAVLFAGLQPWLVQPSMTSCPSWPLIYILHCYEVQSAINTPSCPCRFARLANGGGKVAIADMLQLPELSGNVLMEPILRLFDGDRDGYLTEVEVCRAVRKLGELQQEGADPCQGGIPIRLSDPLHHCGLFCFHGPKAIQLLFMLLSLTDIVHPQ